MSSKLFRSYKLLKNFGSNVLKSRNVNLLQNNFRKRQFSNNDTGIKNNTDTNKQTNEKDENLNQTLGAVASKYQIFRDQDAELILDIEEERRLEYPEGLGELWIEKKDEFEGINLEHGVTGVFDIEDLVVVLKREQAKNIFVATVPPQFKYVDYMVVVNGRSGKHMLALAEFVRKTFKKKRYEDEIIPKIEGKKSKDWIALDLGNIALHIFSIEAREQYDLESLWSVGSEYDTEYNRPVDSLTELIEKHSIYLRDLKPAD